MATFIETEETGDGIVIIRLARPPVNALNPAFLREMDKVFVELYSNVNVKSIVLASAQKVFSAGMDLKEAAAFDLEQQTASIEWLNRAFLRLYGLSKPVIAAVNGAAIAGGLFFPLACDYRVGHAGCKFGLTEVRVGARFPIVALGVARETLPPQGSRRLLLSGEIIDADLAMRWGILDELVDQDEVMDAALAAASRYAGIPPKTFAEVKTQARGQFVARMQSAIDAGSDPLLGGWFNEETSAAMRVQIAAAGRR